MTRRMAAAGVGIVLVAVLAYLVWPSPNLKYATAYFTRTIHIYPGSAVDVLGVRVGTVTSVVPQGSQVRVDFNYDASQRIPADVSAVIIEPTLVADRAVQLTPAFTGGPVLADHAVIPLGHTAVPLELDDFTQQVNQLAVALGPLGANMTGALSRVVQVGDANLRGEGSAAHTTLVEAARLMATLGSNRNALFDTIVNLQQFTTALATHDAETRAFIGDLAQVSAELDAERSQLDAALENLASALTQVASFIHDNRQALASSVASLAGVTNELAREQLLIGRFIDIGTVGITNYPHMYTPAARTFNARFNFNNIEAGPAVFACQLYASVGGSPSQCLQLLAPLKKIPINVAGNPTLDGILTGARP